MNHGQHFHWKVADLRSKSLLTAINPEEVSYYKARLRSGQTIEIIEKTPDELKQFQLGFGEYLMVKPYPARRGVDGEKFDPCSRARPPSTSPSSSTTRRPAWRATAWTSRGASCSCATSPAPSTCSSAPIAGTDRVYFQVAGERAVYAVDAYKLDFLGTKPFDIVDKFLFIPSIDDLDRLDVTVGGATHAFTLTRVTKKATEAGAEDEVVVTYTGDGRELGEDNFKKFYQSVIALSVEGEAPRVVPNAPVVSIRYRLNTGSDTDVKVDLAPYDKIFYASFVERHRRLRPHEGPGRRDGRQDGDAPRAARK